MGVARRGCSEVGTVVGTAFIVFVVIPTPMISLIIHRDARWTPVAKKTRLTPLQSCQCRSTRAPRRTKAHPRAHSELSYSSRWILHTRCSGRTTLTSRMSTLATCSRNFFGGPLQNLRKPIQPSSVKHCLQSRSRQSSRARRARANR